MIHVTFCSAGAGTLRQVLRAKGMRQRVVDLTDELSWGPIATDGFQDRQAWLDRHAPLGFGLWDWIPESVERFRKAVATDHDRLIWIAPHSADEQAGLYWFLHNFDASDAQMIIADYPVRTDGPPRSIGELDEG